MAKLLDGNIKETQSKNIIKITHNYHIINNTLSYFHFIFLFSLYMKREGGERKGGDGII